MFRAAIVQLILRIPYIYIMDLLFVIHLLLDRESVIPAEGSSIWSETAYFFKELIFGSKIVGISKANDYWMKLKEAGADLNAGDTVYKMTRLMWAAARNHIPYLLGFAYGSYH